MLAVLASFVLSQTPTAQAKTVYATQKDTVWRVEALVGQTWYPMGTAFAITHGTRQYVVTCKHVVEATRTEIENGKIVEKPFDGFRLNKNGLILTVKWTVSPTQDAAAARVSNVGSTGRLALLQPMIGDKVYSLGFPGSEGLTLGEGIVNRIASLKGRPYIGHSADIFFGNSGGPLFNESAEVVGINSNWRTDSNHLYFSEIAGDGFKKFLQGL